MTTIIKISNEQEFKQIVKLAKKNGFAFPYNVRRTTYKPIMTLFKKEISGNIKSFCLLLHDEKKLGFPYMEYQTVSYCEEFYYSSILSFMRGRNELYMAKYRKDKEMNYGKI